MRYGNLIDIHNLKVYVTVRETGSMTAAAQLLGMSQSGVSQSVRTLEEALGVQLFDRDTRPLVPTLAGARLYEHVCSIIAEVDRTFELARTGAMTPQPQLNLGVIDSFVGAVGPYLFANIGKIARHYRVWSGIGSELEQELLARQIDVLIASERIEEMAGNVVSFELMTEPYVLAVPKEWKDPGINLAKLAREQNLIRYSLRSVIGKQCPSSKQMGHLSLVFSGGSGSPWFDVMPLSGDGTSGGSGW